MKSTVTKTQAECQALCEGKTNAWDTSSGTGKDDAAFCYGFMWVTSGTVCKILAGTGNLAAAGAGTTSGTDCYLRDASTAGKLYYTLNEASKSGATLHTNYANALGVWKGKVALADVAQGAYDIADKYVTAMKAPYDSAKLLSDAAAKAYEDGSNSNAGTKKDYTTAKADSDGKLNTYNSRKGTALTEKGTMDNAKT